MRALVVALLLAVGCGHLTYSQAAQAGTEIATGCGPGILADAAHIGGAAHAGGADWMTIVQLIFAGIGDAICVAEKVKAHIVAHPTAGPWFAPGPGEVRRYRFIRALARLLELAE